MFTKWIFLVVQEVYSSWSLIRLEKAQASEKLNWKLRYINLGHLFLQKYNPFRYFKLTEPIESRWFSRLVISSYIPVGIYLLEVNTRNTRTRLEICSKLTIRIPERRHWRRSSVFIVNFEHILHLFLVFLWLTFNM